MKIKLIFTDWRKWDGKKIQSIYNTPEGIEASMGVFHSGSTFEGTIDLPEEEVIELKELISQDYRPIFELTDKQKATKRGVFYIWEQKDNV